MARRKTKEQKKRTAQKVVIPKVNVSETGEISILSQGTQIQKNTPTLITNSQVSLVYKDLLKTLLVTIVVVVVLLSIFVYMR